LSKAFRINKGFKPNKAPIQAYADKVASIFCSGYGVFGGCNLLSEDGVESTRVGAGSHRFGLHVGHCRRGGGVPVRVGSGDTLCDHI
jgi:hypothetical protein